MRKSDLNKNKSTTPAIVNLQINKSATPAIVNSTARTTPAVDNSTATKTPQFVNSTATTTPAIVNHTCNSCGNDHGANECFFVINKHPDINKSSKTFAESYKGKKYQEFGHFSLSRGDQLSFDGRYMIPFYLDTTTRLAANNSNFDEEFDDEENPLENLEDEEPIHKENDDNDEEASSSNKHDGPDDWEGIFPDSVLSTLKTSRIL